MEIKDLILLMWRNLKWIVIGLALGVAAGFLVAQVQSPVYEATTKVFVSRSRQQGNVDTLSLSDEQLLAINLQLAKSQTVLNEVASKLGEKVDADNIQAEALPNTLIIQITVQDVDPQRAAAIANLLVETLIQQNDALLSARYDAFETAITVQADDVQSHIFSLQTEIEQVTETSLQEQLTQVNQQIAQLQSDISTLEREIASFPTLPTPLERASLAEKQAQLVQRNALMTLYQQVQTNLTYIGKPSQGGLGMEDPTLATLQSTLSLYQQIHLTLINNRENIRLAREQNRENVMQIVTAMPSKNPVRPMPVLYALLTGMMGLAIAATAILLVDHFDDSMKNASQVEKMLGLPVLGIVPHMEKARNEPSALKRPHSAETDAFRALGASLEILGAGRELHQVMIVSADPRKTPIAANWAVLCAQTGKRVILLDGDLKDPRVHEFFGMENEKGFAEIVGNRLQAGAARLPVQDVDALSVIPGGNVEGESLAWLDPKKAEQFLDDLRPLSDLLIVDGPASDIANAQVLASKMDAVLLVVRQGRTRVETAQISLRRLQVIGANVAGVILEDGLPKQPARIRTFAWPWKRPHKQINDAETKVDASPVSAD